MSSGRRIVWTTILIDFLAFAVFFVIAVFSHTPARVIPSLSFQWELSEALLHFFEWLPGLQFLAVAVAIGSSEGRNEELIQGAILPTVVLSALFSALALVAAPPLESSRNAILATSRSFNSSLESAGKYLASGDLSSAREALNVCLSIARKDPRVKDLDSRVSAAEIKAEKEAKKSVERETVPPKDPAAAKDYYLKALEFFDKGDYFAANWYASTAMKLDPSYTDARRLAAKAWDQMQTKAPDPADIERAAFYSKKLEGYALLRAGDPVGAYRIFKGLSEKHGDDPDVRRYLAESLAGTEKTAFFKDEAEKPLASSPIVDVFLRIPVKKNNSESPAITRLLAARRAALSGGSLYFYELEYLEAGGSGLRALVRTRYAKLAGGKLFLVCVERNRPSELSKPSWAAGPASGPASIVELSLEPEAAYSAISSRSSPSTLSVLEVWKAAASAPNYGIDQAPLVHELLRRTSLPFAVFTAAALGALVGARFRKRGPFEKGLYALVPIMAAALVPVFMLAGRMDNLISAWSAAIAPGLISLAVSAGIRTLVLFVAVMLVAGTRNDRGSLHYR
jgi:hypothetical protein